MIARADVREGRDTLVLLAEGKQPWAAPERPDREWEALSERIVAAAKARGGAPGDDADPTLAPALEAEQGEPKLEGTTKVGGRMGEEQKASEQAPVSRGPKPSLKDLAAKARAAGPNSLPPASLRSASPAELSIATAPLADVQISTAELPPASVGPASVAPATQPSASLAPSATVASADVIDLAAIRAAKEAAVNEAQRSASEPPPSEAPTSASSGAGKSGESIPPPSMLFAQAAKPVAASAHASAERKSNRSAIGLGLAAAGIAAAFAIVKSNQPTQVAAKAPSQPASALVVVEQEAPVMKAAAPEAQAAAGPKAVDISQLDTAPTATAAAQGGAVAKSEGAGTAAPTAEVAPTAAPTAEAVAARPSSSGSGDIDSEIARTTGRSGELGEGVKATPAAAQGPKTVPETPPTGKVMSAVRAVLGGARACVEGADSDTNATITFASSGAVQSVSVSGWAASNGKSGCVKSALKGANVGPFQKASFSAPVTVRP